MKKILLINGANLNRLHTRDPAMFGGASLDDVVEYARIYAREYDFELDHFQSNHEGQIVDKIQEADSLYDGIIINPGPFSQYSHAIRVTLASLSIASVEVHFVNIHKTQEETIPGRNATGVVSGFGKDCYRLGIDALRHCFAKEKHKV